VIDPAAIVFDEHSLELLAGQVLLRAVPAHRVQSMNAVAVDVEYHTFSEEVYTFPERRPWAFNVLLATFKTCLADLVVQVTDARPSSAGGASSSVSKGIDWRRSFFFAMFGCLYVGMVQWLFYVSLFGWLCPEAAAFANKPLASKLVDKVGQEDLLIQVLVDQLVINPLIYFPTFYIVKEAFFGARGPAESVVGGLRRYGSNFLQDNFASWCVWFPADFLIFTAPMYFRMPLDHAVAFLWTMIMSHMRGGVAAPPKAREGAARDGTDHTKTMGMEDGFKR
jgi:hypothetical protein